MLLIQIFINSQTLINLKLFDKGVYSEEKNLFTQK
jgi:hypothetical protein